MRVGIIGAGLYGCHAARVAASMGHDVIVFEKRESFASYETASTVNQARVHGGYHYPRSISTAREAREHRVEFELEFADALLPEYPQVYAIPKLQSFCTATQFEAFCERSEAPLQVTSDPILTDRVEKAYLTDERAIDTVKMMWIARGWLMHDRISYKNIEVESISDYDECSLIINSEIIVDRLINCAYGDINEIQRMLHVSRHEPENARDIARYERCEINLIKDPDGVLKGKGFTFMDGPFCSIMPFTDEFYSLTSVSFTPISDKNDKFDSPESNFNSSVHMMQELSLYIDPNVVQQLVVCDTISTVKAVPAFSDVDDSRNVCYRLDPTGKFISILGGKLTAVYEITSHLQEFLS